MAERITTTLGGDAPLSTARNSDPSRDVQGAAEDFELVGRTVSINRPRQELYAFWRDFRNLPLFMENIESVAVAEGGRSHWTVRGPAGSDLEWDSILTEDVPGERIAWRSVEGGSIDHSGRVEFRDSSNGRGSIVTATIAYHPPAGALGKWFAKVFRREPKLQARQELRRFKQLMETGELPTAAITAEQAVTEEEA